MDHELKGTYNCPVCGWNVPHAEHAGDMIQRLQQENRRWRDWWRHTTGQLAAIRSDCASSTGKRLCDDLSAGLGAQLLPPEFVLEASVSTAPEQEKRLLRFLVDIRKALLSLNIDGCDVWNHWMDEDGSLSERGDALLREASVSTPSETLIARLEALIAKMHAEAELLSRDAAPRGWQFAAGKIEAYAEELTALRDAAHALSGATPAAPLQVENRVWLNEDVEQHNRIVVGTVKSISPMGYVRVQWDEPNVYPESHFSPATALNQLRVVTGDDALPRHDWDCQKDQTDPPCLRCGVIQTDANELGPCTPVSPTAPEQENR